MVDYDPSPGPPTTSTARGPPPETSPPKTSPPEAEHRPAAPAEMDVSTPTLRWISLTDPQDTVALGEQDYVLDSVFNMQYGSWEVLVLVQPTETEE